MPPSSENDRRRPHVVAPVMEQKFAKCEKLTWLLLPARTVC